MALFYFPCRPVASRPGTSSRCKTRKAPPEKSALNKPAEWVTDLRTCVPQGRNPLTARYLRPSLTTFRINTCKSVSKQKTLTIFRINTYEKRGEGGLAVPLRELCTLCGEILPWPLLCLRRRLRRPAHHPEANILRRGCAIRLRIRWAIRAAAHHFALAVARQHPFRHVAAQIKN